MVWTLAALAYIGSSDPKVVLIMAAIAFSIIAGIWRFSRTNARGFAQRLIPPEDVAPRLQTLIGMGLPDAIAEPLARGEKINAIKAYRETYSSGLKQAKDAVEAWERARRTVDSASPPQ